MVNFFSTNSNTCHLVCATMGKARLFLSRRQPDNRMERCNSQRDISTPQLRSFHFHSLRGPCSCIHIEIKRFPSIRLDSNSIRFRNIPATVAIWLFHGPLYKMENENRGLFQWRDGEYSMWLWLHGASLSHRSITMIQTWEDEISTVLILQYPEFNRTGWCGRKGCWNMVRFKWSFWWLYHHYLESHGE